MIAPPELSLPTVTLCAATSVNLTATVQALRLCLGRIRFADCVLFTDDKARLEDPLIRKVRVDRLRSSEDYSAFMLEQLVDHVPSDHVLVVQWDGFILNPTCWEDRFLDFDYIGAPWPQFDDGYDVGNGGFSLRSKRLLEVCRQPGFRRQGPEDVAICRENRRSLEIEHGIRFAPRDVAERFSFERTQPIGPTFGFHGVFNMIPVLGSDRFWSLYKGMDERSSVQTDLPLLLKQLNRYPDAKRRQSQLIVDRFRSLFKR